MSPGVVVTTGRALDREVSSSHALEVRSSDGALGASARLSVTLLDINDHAPVFTQRFYQLRAPVLEVRPHFTYRAHSIYYVMLFVRTTHNNIVKVGIRICSIDVI